MTSSASDARYQIRIQLDHVSPPIWRDVIVPVNISLRGCTCIKIHRLFMNMVGFNFLIDGEMLGGRFN